jgi:hypothetical protein
MNDFEEKGFLRRNAIWIVILAAFAIFGFLLFKGWDQVVNEGIDGMVTVTGNFSCLPLKEEVEEDVCTLGIRSRDGAFYALDVSRIQDANTDLSAEDTIAVTGTMKPEGEIAGSEWAVFDISGIIQVNTLLRTR